MKTYKFIKIGTEHVRIDAILSFSYSPSIKTLDVVTSELEVKDGFVTNVVRTVRGEHAEFVFNILKEL